MVTISTDWLESTVLSTPGGPSPARQLLVGYRRDGHAYSAIARGKGHQNTAERTPESRYSARKTSGLADSESTGIGEL